MATAAAPPPAPPPAGPTGTTGGPVEAAQGLAETAQIRGEALAASIPTVPADQYLSTLAATIQTVWTGRLVDLGTHVATGLAEAAAAIGYYEAAEAGNATGLGA